MPAKDSAAIARARGPQGPDAHGRTQLPMEPVPVGSPFMFRNGDMGLRRPGVLGNLACARCALHNSFPRGEAPYASHLLSTQPFFPDGGVLRS